jgi:hypothetical protein
MIQATTTLTRADRRRLWGGHASPGPHVRREMVSSQSRTQSIRNASVGATLRGIEVLESRPLRKTIRAP